MALLKLRYTSGCLIYSPPWTTHYYGLLTTMGYSPPWATHYYGLSPGKPYVEALLPSVVVFGGEALGGS